MPGETRNSPATQLPSWLSQYLFMGVLASGGGAVGSLAVAPRTEILEVKIERLEENLERYGNQVTESYTELERRIDRLERQHPELP